ncbi:MAG: GNAT family N-acetyltransferase [Oscillospiraceae bacterium]|nr:GNAT family N-acetyltransferase [Oscillospiraceae bacterium]
MDIRYMQPGDDPVRISDIYEQSWRYAYRGIIPQEHLDSIPKGKWVTHLGREGMHTLVAEHEGQLVGTASFCSSRWESYSGYGEIVSIYFLPEHMGKGYGTALLHRCMEELRGMGYENVLLWVLEDNTQARCFYEKNGFVLSGDVLDDQIGGKDLREVMYRKELGSGQR